VDPLTDVQAPQLVRGYILHKIDTTSFLEYSTYKVISCLKITKDKVSNASLMSMRGSHFDSNADIA